MRRKKSLSGSDGLAWQCPDCSRIHGSVAARDLLDIEPALLTSFPWVHHVKKPQPNSKRRAYIAALHSPHWKKMRALVFERAEGKCEMRAPGCIGEASEVHHVSYARLGNEDLSDLAAACGRCNSQEREQRIVSHVLGK